MDSNIKDALKIPDVQPGLYVLTREIENPKPDRRHKYDWRLSASWGKGTIFNIRSRPVGFAEEEIEIPSLSIFKNRKATYQEIDYLSHPELWALLLEALKRKPDPPKRETVKNMREKARKLADHLADHGSCFGGYAARMIREVLIEGKDFPL